MRVVEQVDSVRFRMTSEIEARHSITEYLAADFYGIIYDTNTYFAVRIRIKGILVFTCAVAFFVDFNISFAF